MLRRLRAWGEPRRGRVLVGLAVVALLGFLGGPFVFALWAPLVLAVALSFNFELVRPIAPDPVEEGRRGLLVHGLLLSFVPGLLLMAGFSAGILPEPPPKSRRLSNEETLLLVVPQLMAAGAWLAAADVVRRRGTTWEGRLFTPIRWLVPGLLSVAFVQVVVLRVVGWNPNGFQAIGAMAALGALFVAVPLLALVVSWAMARTLRPARTWGSVAEPAKAAGSLPTFEAARLR